MDGARESEELAWQQLRQASESYGDGKVGSRENYVALGMSHYIKLHSTSFPTSDIEPVRTADAAPAVTI